MIKQYLSRHMKRLLVSTYLFVRCENHKCVQHLCEEVPKTWLLVGWFTFDYLSLFEPFARGSLILYKCPRCTWFCENFSPHPPSPSLHVPPSCLSHLYTSRYTWIYFRRNHLRVFRLGLTRVLLSTFHFLLVWVRYFHTQWSQWTFSTLFFAICSKTTAFDVRFFKWILSPRDGSNTLDGGHEPKIQPKS